MKRPFSILTLSDLHVDVNRADRLTALEKLPIDLHCWINLQKDDYLKWTPDYVAIPGDIIDCHTNDPGNSYELARKKIDLILLQFKLSEKRVIVAPGNHDRKVARDNELKGARLRKHRNNYKKLKDDFLTYCLHPDDHRAATNFCGHHTDAFKEFCTFNEKFVAETDCYDWTSDESLRYTSVLKVFPELEVCFLSVNTEWLYTRSKITQKEEMYLALPAVMPMIKRLNDLAHYTIITLMHRKPDSLSWKDNNGDDQPVHSSLSHIKRCSDIIISGHDHNLRTGRPDVIENRIQHFKLGSPSCKGDTEFKYSVSVIHVNPISHTIKLLRGEFLAEGKWDFKEEPGTFPLRNKYIADAGLDTGSKLSLQPHSDPVRLQTRHWGDVEIEEAIRDYFYKQRPPDEWELKPVCVDTKPNLTVPDSPTHIVLYTHYTDKMALSRLNDKYDELCNAPDNHKRRLLQQLIVSKVIVEVPKNNDKKDRL